MSGNEIIQLDDFPDTEAFIKGLEEKFEQGADLVILVNNGIIVGGVKPPVLDI